MLTELQRLMSTDLCTIATAFMAHTAGAAPTPDPTLAARDPEALPVAKAQPWMEHVEARDPAPEIVQIDSRGAVRMAIEAPLRG